MDRRRFLMAGVFAGATTALPKAHADEPTYMPAYLITVDDYLANDAKRRMADRIMDAAGWQPGDVECIDVAAGRALLTVWEWSLGKQNIVGIDWTEPLA